MYVTEQQLRAALEQHARRHADIGPATYQRPNGRRGQHTIRGLCSEKDIRASGPVGKTFRPGTKVLVARRLGGPDMLILNDVPPSGRGSGSFQTSRRGSGGASPPAIFIGFRIVASGMRRGRYLADGSPHPAETQENTPELAGADTNLITELGGFNARLMLRDSGAMAGVNSLIVQGGDEEPTRIWVFDYDAMQVYTYTAPAGFYCALPFYRAGFLYWAEYEEDDTASSTTVNFRRSAANLSGVTTVGTVAVTGVSGPWDSESGTVVTDTAYRLGVSDDGVAGGGFEARFTWAGAGTFVAPAVLLFGKFDPAAFGGAVGWDHITDPPSLYATDDTLGAAVAARWPQTDDWALTQITGEANASPSSDGSEAIAYGLDANNAGTIVRAPSHATSGEPTSRVLLGHHPGVGSAPHVIFLVR